MTRTRNLVFVLCIALSLGLVLVVSSYSSADGKSGDTLFKQHCASCHPNGGNIINPKKTLSKKDREANGIKSKDDIVKYMRKPGPGMTSFDDKAISDKAAQELAEYIHKTFK